MKIINIKQLTILLASMLFPFNKVVANSQQHFEKANAFAMEGKWQEAIIAYNLAIKY